jgi:hypothetical protein
VWILAVNYEMKTACDLWKEVLKVKEITGDAEYCSTPNIIHRLAVDYLSMMETESAIDLMEAMLEVTQSTLGANIRAH